MDALMEVFPVVIYGLLVALLILLIVLIVKVMHTVDRTNRILDDIESKTKSLNGLFHVIDGVTDSLAVFSDTLVSGITNIASKIFSRRKKRKEKEIDEYE